MSGFLAILRRDLTLAVRIGGGTALALVFFATVVALVPLGVGANLPLLGAIAPGVLWVAATLSALLSLDRLFQADFEDGSLDQIALADLPLQMAVLAKCLAHWLTTGLPLALASPVLALLLNLPDDGYLPLVLSLLTGTPALSLIGAIGAALTVGIRRGGLLLSLLAMPLFVPVLIFGSGAVSSVLNGFDPAPAFALLGALTLFSLVLGPLAAAAAIRNHLS